MLEFECLPLHADDCPFSSVRTAAAGSCVSSLRVQFELRRSWYLFNNPPPQPPPATATIAGQLIMAVVVQPAHSTDPMDGLMMTAATGMNVPFAHHLPPTTAAVTAAAALSRKECAAQIRALARRSTPKMAGAMMVGRALNTTIATSAAPTAPIAANAT